MRPARPFSALAGYGGGRGAGGVSPVEGHRRRGGGGLLPPLSAPAGGAGGDSGEGNGGAARVGVLGERGRPRRALGGGL